MPILDTTLPAPKQALDDLAFFGGRPAFPEPLHVGRPNIGNREKFLTRVNDTLDRKWLTNDGRYVIQFEKRLAELTGVKHCLAMCNATIALEIVIRALGLKGQVILPSFTFIATAHVLQWQDITPVFCDIDPRTHTIDPEKVEALITPETTGILAVNLWGWHCDIAALEEIARRRGLKLLFDSAHALGCSYKDRMIGGFGDAEVFSFHATKFVNSLEGGAVLTNDDELARKTRLMRNFGFVAYDQVASIGTNGKMSEVSAAMGLTNLESIDEFIAINRRNHKQYAAELAGLKGITVLSNDDQKKRNYQYVVLEIDAAETIVSRDELMQILYRENILARRYFYPGCHRMAPYNSYLSSLSLPQTEKVSERVLSLPTGTSISPADISTICGVIRMVVNNGREVSAKLRSQAATST
ncbi:MAG TPA: aminotransferase class I/II-fold pyridoxal phosphate-dependent enzyme [Pyrinomonadaceae bacterium]|nr:aminotransferase class I/II-fold pyridoxal phosphate-dependent enzyme [Pyrinomonadaceae bacterium]